MIHDLDDFTQLLVAQELFSLETEVVAKLPQAHWTKCEWFLISFIQLR